MPYASIKNLIDENYPRNKVIRVMYTYPLSFLIYSLIINTNSKSYLELGCGYGGVMLMAGMGLDDARKIYRRKTDFYRLVGVDLKKHRLKEAEQILSKYRFTYNLIHGDTLKFNTDEKFDVIFIDCGEHLSQQLIDKFSGNCDKVIVVHDVITEQKLYFPEQFSLINFSQQRALIAFNKKYFNNIRSVCQSQL